MVHICGLIALSGRGTPESVLETGIGEKRIFEAIYCFSFVCKKIIKEKKRLAFPPVILSLLLFEQVRRLELSGVFIGSHGLEQPL